MKRSIFKVWSFANRKAKISWSSVIRPQAYDQLRVRIANQVESTSFSGINLVLLVIGFGASAVITVGGTLILTFFTSLPIMRYAGIGILATGVAIGLVTVFLLFRIYRTNYQTWCRLWPPNRLVRCYQTTITATANPLFLRTTLTSFTNQPLQAPVVLSDWGPIAPYHPEQIIRVTKRSERSRFYYNQSLNGIWKGCLFSVTTISEQKSTTIDDGTNTELPWQSRVHLADYHVISFPSPKMAGSDFMLQPHHHLGDLTLHHRVQLESPTFNQLFLLRDFSDQPIILRKHLQPRIMAVMIDLVDKYHFVPTIRVKNQQVSIIFAVSHWRHQVLLFNLQSGFRQTRVITSNINQVAMSIAGLYQGLEWMAALTSG